MAKLYRYVVLALYFLPGAGLPGQTPAVLDSVKNLLQQAPNDSVRWQHSLDLAAKYSRRSFDTARWYGEESLRYAEKTGLTLPVSSSLNTLGSIYNFTGDQETALKYYFQALEIAARDGHKQRRTRTFVRHIGNDHTHRVVS